VPIALLVIVVAIIAFYLAAGVIRYLRQEFQPPPEERKGAKQRPRKR
jgi:hypothetical protein